MFTKKTKRTLTTCALFLIVGSSISSSASDFITSYGNNKKGLMPISGRAYTSAPAWAQAEWYCAPVDGFSYESVIADSAYSGSGYADTGYSKLGLALTPSYSIHKGSYNFASTKTIKKDF